ncbi:MFS transporter [Vibrio sp. D404a]|uniref:MFS transporter n=1 Tax=unclassified Vibrio TaxID=2614977 RepID=UPI002555E98C|nr:MULTISPECIES: MFS transporter [unclassified Vibrio]MDK9735697.1 MFS transporter [Vibrio sp. D404a]MDK9798613.1 MFS transporter [Vibrio sp. D449a]
MTTTTTTKADPKKWFPLYVLLAAQFSTMSDNAGLAVATEAMLSLFGSTMAEIQMANAIYPLVAAAGMITGGLTGLIIGWKRQMIIGAALMAISAFASSVAPNMDVLNYVARLSCGVAGCLLIPAVLANIAGIYKGKDQAIAFASIAAFLGVASALAPVIFGFMIDIAGFRAAFAVQGLYCAVLTASVILVIPNIDSEKFSGKIDFTGIILAAIGLAFFVTGLLKISEWGLIEPLGDVQILGISPSLVSVALGIMILIALIKWEKKFELSGGTPLLPQIFLTNPQVLRGLYLCATVFLLFGFTSFVNVSFMQLVAGFNAIESASALVVFAVGMIVGSIATTKQLSHLTCRRVTQLGFVLVASGVLMMFLGFDVDGITWWQFPSLLLFGTGTGIVASQSSLVVTDALPEKEARQSGGIQATFRNFGQAMGVAILGSIMLFSFTGEIKKDVISASNLSYETQEIISQEKLIPFSSNEMVVGMMENSTIDQSDYNEVLAIVADSRLTSVNYTMLVLLIWMSLSISICNGLPNYSLMKDKI